MLFNSWAFVGLVVLTMALYYSYPVRGFQVALLILASFVFYASSEPALLLLLIASIAINIFTSHHVMHGGPAWRKRYAVAGVVLNLGILAAFKYSPLFATTFLARDSSLSEFLVGMPLPIGISFFTFQGITLLVDVLREKERRADFHLAASGLYRHITDTTLYIAFFPQLVAGPIVKAHDFMPQIGAKRLGEVDWAFCVRALVTGYFLKMVVADNLKDQTFWLTFPYFESQSSVDLLVMLFGYSMQIFADFAGYSLIAIGVAALFGYRLPQNFNFPYISLSITEFWRRWHISLSSFLREYLYFPLGGNRKGAVRTYINLMLVMLLGGLWHGAAWSYMLWGGFHGVALATERFFSTKVTLPGHWLIKLLRMILVFSFVTFAWLLFKLPDFGQVIDFVHSVASNWGIAGKLQIELPTVIYSLPVIAYHIYYLLGQQKASRVDVRGAAWQPLAYGAMMFLILTNSGMATAFVYFQF